MQLVTQVTKYIPGNIWGAVLQAQLIGSARVGSLFLAGMDSTILFMMTVTSTGVALLVYCHNPALGWIAALGGWFISSAVAASAWVSRFGHWLAKLTGRQPPATTLPPTLREVCRLFAFTILHSLTMLLSFFCMLAAATPYRHDDLIISVASICLAWVAGTIAIVVPSGLGVRELAFVAIAAKLGVPADAKLLAAISIVARVAQTLPDILAAGVVGIVELGGAHRKLRARSTSQ